MTVPSAIVSDMPHCPHCSSIPDIEITPAVCYNILYISPGVLFIGLKVIPAEYGK